MLNACMINGFGWFPEENYRRTLLLFDEIDYVFPQLVKDVNVPPQLYGATYCRLVQPNSTLSDIERRLSIAESTAKDPAFIQLTTSIPPGDLEFAISLLSVDNELVGYRSVTEGPVAISYIVDKLLDYCEASQSVPVVGQEYAGRILSFKARSRLQNLTSGTKISNRQSVVIQRVSAGLSYSFVSDAELLRLSYDEILKFKHGHEDLLDRHHEEILSTANRFAELAEDEGRFAEGIIALRQAAARTRTNMEREAAEAWRAAGLNIFQKAIVAFGGSATALGLIAANFPHPSELASVPAALAGLGLAAAAALGAADKIRLVRTTHMSYLIGVEKWAEG